METTFDTSIRHSSVAPKKRGVKRVSADAHLRADPANKRALDQAIAQCRYHYSKK